MPDLLLELFSEEIPARMQAGAASELERLVVGALSERGILFESARRFSGPRRLTLAFAGLPLKQPEVSEERKGPRVGAPQPAIDGFLRSAGVTLEQCMKQKDSKGEFYVALLHRAGRATAEVLAELLPVTISQLQWPKSMRWDSGAARWVRPLHRIVCIFDDEIVPFVFAGVKSGNATIGHRFMSAGEIEVRSFEDYEEKLWVANVVLDPLQRREIILHETRQKAFALGTELVEDKALLDEVVGLVEWPVVLTGKIDDDFMNLPPEILQTSMRVHQKFFTLRDIATATLSDRFVTVANIAADDGGSEIIAGNERVLRSRLADARFFWDQDRKRSLISRLVDLRKVVFHAKAGSMHDRALRIAIVALLLARTLKFDVEKSCRAALLAKVDLVTGVVGEFPELQGVMGSRYALNDGEDPEVADAVRNQYRPVGPTDDVPRHPVGIVLALADKIDSLVALWRAGEKPTGSKDPFALRRAGLGIIRIILDNSLRIPLSEAMGLVVAAFEASDRAIWQSVAAHAVPDNHMLAKLAADLLERAISPTCGNDVPRATPRPDQAVVAGVLEFLTDRLKVALRDEGLRHDLIDAVFACGGEDDVVRLVSRVRALKGFLETGDGANLLAGYRRAANILRIEEKRDGRSYEGEPDSSLLEASEEKNLFVALSSARDHILIEIREEQFGEAMTCMARLREPVDAFFDKVTVNAGNALLRQNRLLLLAGMRNVLHTVADFSRIEG
jgi:glycyl-tRNA synthetase beta chain